MLEFDLRAAIELVKSAPTALSPADLPIDPTIEAEFRDALDRTRHALWVFLAAREAEDAREAASAAIGYRMTRVAEMLSLLRATDSKELAALEGSDSFIEQVQAMAALTLDKHLAKKTPAA